MNHPERGPAKNPFSLWPFRSGSPFDAFKLRDFLPSGVLSALHLHDREPCPAGPEEKRRVVCFECHTPQRVSRSAASTQCRACSTFIDLRDLEVRTPLADRIRTRGDVTVHKKGALLGTAVFCGNLTLHGPVSGAIHAQETVEIGVSCKIIGEIRCRRLVVAQKCAVDCHQPVYASEILVQGSLHGNILVSGRAVIDTHGSIDGSLTAGSLSVRPGGVLNAAVEVTGVKDERENDDPSPGNRHHLLNAALL